MQICLARVTASCARRTSSARCLGAGETGSRAAGHSNRSHEHRQPDRRPPLQGDPERRAARRPARSSTWPRTCSAARASTPARPRSCARSPTSTADRVLDLGCGYGPLGLFLKAWEPARVVHLVDRDELAVRFAARNAELNGLGRGRDIPEPRVRRRPRRARSTSSSPTSRPRRARRSSSRCSSTARTSSPPGGTMADRRDQPAGPRRARRARAGGVEVVFERENRGYLCMHYRYRSAPTAPYANGFDRGIYDRGRLRYGGVDITTVHGLPDFDTVGLGDPAGGQDAPRPQGDGSRGRLESWSGNRTRGAGENCRPRRSPIGICSRSATRTARRARRWRT